jgi:hypothetical protein
MGSGRIFQALGLIVGFTLIDYGFNVLSIGFPGARTFTSDFLATNLLLGGSVLVFVSLYYLLKPARAAVVPSPTPQLVGERPDVGVEIIAEENTPPKPGFYKTIEYVGYFFTILGLISAADLALQVFLRTTYNEARWWVEVLLVTFGVLSYTIFGSVGRIGMQEEAKLKTRPSVTEADAMVAASAGVPTSSPTPEPPTIPLPPQGPLNLKLSEFKRNSAGEYEKHLAGEFYDMFRLDRDLVTVWREDRRGMRSVYMAGPYEVTREMLEEHAQSGDGLAVGELTLAPDAIRGLLELKKSGAELTNESVPHGE